MPLHKLYVEPELLLRVAKGDETAFAKFVEPIFDRLFGFALSATKSSELAEEIVQDVFLRIWQHRTELTEIDNLTGWVFTITRNLTYNTIRRQLTEPQLVRHLDTYFLLTPASAVDNLSFKETLALVQQAAGTLPPQQEVVFKLNRIRGLTLDEIAEQLKLSKETVKKHLTQALKTVRTYLRAHSGEVLMVPFVVLWLLP